MIDIWLMAYYLGIGMKKMEDQIFISQEGYAKEMLGTCWLLKGMGGKCLKMDVDCKLIDLKAQRNIKRERKFNKEELSAYNSHPFSYMALS